MAVGVGLGVGLGARGVLLTQTRRQIIRDWSNRHYFSCAHVHMLLRLFSMETQQSLRVEVLVITYSRTVDWHGALSPHAPP